MTEGEPIPGNPSLVERRASVHLAKEMLRLAQEVVGFIDPGALSISEFDTLRNVKTDLHTLEQSMNARYIELETAIMTKALGPEEVEQ
jgi:hypothetical protein